MENGSDFLGKTVLITGCNRGIGKGLLTFFASQGSNLLCCVRKIDPAFSKFVNELELSDKQYCRIIEFDIKDDEKMKKVTTELVKEKLIIDILINNAGIADGSIVEMTPMRQIKDVFEVNFFGQINLIQRLLRLLKKSNNGRIINVGSISGISGEKGTLSYGASKCALMFATKVMANEFSKYGINVNAIAPGVTTTNMADKMDKNERELSVKRSFKKRESEISEVVNVIKFLASDDASFINGQIIRVDGGMIN